MKHEISFDDILKNPEEAEGYIQGRWSILETAGMIGWLENQLVPRRQTINEIIPSSITPDQGLIVTGYEGDRLAEGLEIHTLPDEVVQRTVQGWLYYLELLNHPARLEALFDRSKKPFEAPGRGENTLFADALARNQAINIADLKLQAGGTSQPRQSRTDLHQNGPFVPYGHMFGEAGRNQARNVIVGGANPDIFGDAMAIATLAQAHSLVALPRDGFFSKIPRQVQLAKKVFEWLENSPILVGKEKGLQAQLLDFYKHNVVGVLEPSPRKAMERAQALYDAGIRTFRIYSPEPGSDALETLKALRRWEKEKGWDKIEIFVGQVIDVEQALALQDAGADALFVGVGGGGRCITGLVGGLTINWPQLVWELRSKVQIPIIVEGGANDYINETLAVGASGIGAVGKFGGTIETPGGIQYFVDRNGQIFKYYGGEASDRMRAMAGRHAPFGAMLNTEGETTRKLYRNGNNRLPTLLQVLHEMQQGIVAGQVFQNVGSIYEMQMTAAQRLVWASPNDDLSRKAHA